ncbi:MAG: hypothetical protein P9M00_13215 [Candidatus Tritonobacter lacicola]|nr:hypothetical protein [Candidatus Tritonobacter lacicola]
MANEKERFEVLLEEMESKFNLVIETLIALRDDFKKLRDVVASHEERPVGHDLRQQVFERE